MAEPVRLNSLLKMLKGETVPQVLVEVLLSIGRSIGHSDAVRTHVLAATRHPSEQVRMQAALWITSSHARDRSTVMRALTMVQTDPSMTIRKRLCRRLGRRPTPEVLELLAKQTLDSTSPLYGSCLMGLINGWTNPQSVLHPTIRPTL